MDIIDELKKDNNSLKKGRGRIAFLAYKNDISDALKEGYKAKDIWEILYKKKRISIQYRAFMVYVKKYITDIEKKKMDNQPKQTTPDKNRLVAGGETNNTVANENGHKVLKVPDTRPKLEPFDAEKNNARDDLI